MGDSTLDTGSPPASKLRPMTLDKVVGQKYIANKDKLLYHAIQADQSGSIILYGSPGARRTTLARVIANTTKADFRQTNAIVTGKRDVEEMVKETKDVLGMYRKKTILFVDEIHRLSRSQQDYLLLFAGDGALMLIGATTENPYFEVNGALTSRSRILELKALEKEDIKELLHRVVYNREKGMGSYNAEMEDDALESLANVSNGDARAALNTIELGILTTERGEGGRIHINLGVTQEYIQKRVVRHDEDGNSHYDTISVFIKSMRGSDPNAAVYYLTRMPYAGEDIKFIARRIMIRAAEDVGIAGPMALTIVASASQAVERIGIPETQIILSQAVLYVATAPKSNSVVTTVNVAMNTVKSERTMPVLVHLQGRHCKGAEKLGHGVGYLYAHDYPNHYVKQRYLPDGMKGVTFHHPPDNGYEAQIQEYFRRIQS